MYELVTGRHCGTTGISYISVGIMAEVPRVCSYFAGQQAHMESNPEFDISN